MTNENSAPNETEANKAAFGTRLRAAREALGLACKDVAIQLRLPERVIFMMEKERYAPDLPVTFIRGYIRAYGKFLQIPEQEISVALEPLKEKTPVNNIIPLSSRNLGPLTSDHYFMQIFSYVILVTIISLVGVWGYTHYSQPFKILTEAVSPVLPHPILAIAPTAPTIIPTSQQQAPEEKNIVPAAKEIKTADANKVNTAKIIQDHHGQEEDVYDESDMIE